jgi:hypothetical protein
MIAYPLPLFVACALGLLALACGDDAGPGGSPASGGVGGSAGAAGGGGSAGGSGVGGSVPVGDTTVEPNRIDDVLVNPNMGFADFHFGWWCNLPPVSYTPEECAKRASDNRPENYPGTAVAYFRWTWRQIEPVRGQIDFSMIDNAIQSANLLGETLSFRVMVIEEGGAGVPDWLLAAPHSAQGVTVDGTFWPDYRDPSFQAEHARLLGALGDRYDDHPAVDHVDIGTVGCWGEWNTACLSGADSIIDVYQPSSDAERDAIATAYRQVIDDHAAAFQVTPLVMLGLGGTGREREIMVHAMKAKAGWRVDCWGDWEWFSTSWSHQGNLYPDMIAAMTQAYPAFPEVWKHAPIQLEVCGTIEGWHGKGWSVEAPDGYVHKSFQWALEQHAAVLNAKRSPIPADYVPAMQELLKKNGYRYVIDQLNHESRVQSGGQMVLGSSWSNLGVTPSYTRRTLSYRLRSAATTRAFETDADVRSWLPGSWQRVDSFSVPSDLPKGPYAIEVAILDRAGENPTTAALPPLFLGIEGRGSDGWYALSELIVE